MRQVVSGLIKNISSDLLRLLGTRIRVGSSFRFPLSSGSLKNPGARRCSLHIISIL